MTDRNSRDESLVRQFLSLTKEMSQQESADLIDEITQSDVSRWRRDEWTWITKRKRRALKEYLEREEQTPAAPSPLGDPTGSPAERLIYYFSHPDAVRQLGPSVSAEDRVKAAYAIAIEDSWPEEEIDKLGAWRREVLGGSGEPDAE